MIKSEELTQMKERAEKATTGPWYSHVDGTVFLKHTQEIADVWTDNEEADAAFIAHAREDVPRLVAEVEHLSALLRQRDRQLKGERKGSQSIRVEIERLQQAMKYACEMMTIGESRKANEKLCEALGVPDDYFEEEYE